MKHKTWFRLVVKALGLYCMAMGIPELLATAAWVIQTLLSDDAQTWSASTYLSTSLVGPMAFVGVGLWLFLGAGWFANLAIPSNREYCPECGYDISKSSEATCPECGTARVAAQPRASDSASAAAAEERSRV